MTPMEQELAHLKRMLEPPLTAGWLDYCLAKAQGMESRRPELYAGLSDAVQLHASSLKLKKRGE